MPDIPLPITSTPGLRPSEGGGRLINAYVEALAGDAQAGYVRRRVPGMELLAQTGHDICRGFIYVGSVLLAAQGTKLVAIEADGAGWSITVLGDLGGSGRVTFASNNKSPTPDILCVTSAGMYTCTVGGAPSSFSDPDVPQPNSVCFIDGYFMLTIRDGRCFASGLNNTAFAALDFATAEGKAGGLFRGVAYGQQLYLFGPKAIEPWANTANDTGFPFSRTTVIPVGLVSPYAVAGFEDGFSATLMFVGNDRRVWRSSGGTPGVVSTPDVDRALAAVADPEDITALVFSAAGHPQWVVTGPTFTWVFDLSTEKWHERKSYEKTHWRAACSVNAFDGWVVGDALTDHLGIMDEAEQEEYGDPLIWEVTSAPAQMFPSRIGIARMDANFVVGQGKPSGREPIETRPTVAISNSKDGGASFSVPVIRSLGRTGQSRARVNVNRLGLSGPQGVIYKYVISDPVYVGLMSATHEAEARPR